MNPKQQLHMATLSQWADLIRDQAASGLTVKEWCAQQGVTIHKYNYWKHQLKESYIDTNLHELVAIDTSGMLLEDVPAEKRDTISCESRDSRNAISIKATGINIEIEADVSDALVASIIKAVRYA